LRSIPRHHRRRRLAEIEAVIDPEFDRVDLLVDVGGHRTEIAQQIDEGHAVLAEIVEIVFDLGRPIVPERPFDAGARGPADPGLLAGEVKGRGNAQNSQATPNRAASGKGLAGEERMAVDRGRGGNYYADACCLSGRDGNTRLPAFGSVTSSREAI